jgi:hypothetical protein
MGRIADLNHSWEALYVPNLAYQMILGVSCLSELDLLRIEPRVTDACPLGGLGTNPVSAIATPSPPENDRLTKFLDTELPKFDEVTGRTSLIEHTIRLKENAIPVKQRYYPRNPAMQAVINEEAETMLHEGVIEPSTSPWSSPVVLL